MKSSMKRKIAIALSLFALGFLQVEAANNTTGTGAGVAIGPGSKAGSDSVGLGRDFNSEGYGTTSVGYQPRLGVNGGMVGGIFLGTRNSSLYGTGQMEYYLGLVKDVMPRANQGYTNINRVPAATLIGSNILSRTGDTIISAFDYTGRMGEGTGILSGNTPEQSNIINRTILGVNSFYNGVFVTGIGAYSTATGNYSVNRSGYSNNFLAAQNMGAVIGGSLNRNMNTDSNYDNGVANIFAGLGNSAKDSNAALLTGVGNRVSSSYRYVDVGLFMGATAGNSVDEMVGFLTGQVFTADSAGSTLTMGSGNFSNYSIGTQMLGSRNTVNGTAHTERGWFGTTSTVIDTQGKYLSIVGDGNTLNHTSSSSNYAVVLGSNNTFESISNSVTMGNGKIFGKAIEDSVIIGGDGSSEEVKSIVSLGTGSSVATEGGVALGHQAKAVTLAEVIGYDPKTEAPSTETSSTWKSTGAAVSVGDVANRITRQIVGVAAGSEDTDMANVAQLKQLRDQAVHFVENEDKAHMNLKTDGIKMTEGKNLEEGAEYTLSLKDLNVDSITYTDSTESSTTKTILNKQGMTILRNGNEQGPSVTENGVDSAEKSIINVAAGTEDSDGINVGQLRAVEDKLPVAENAIKSYRHQVSNRADKMGAGLAALSALKPLDYAEGDKWNVAAGYGHYKGKSAVALGVYYHRNEEEMLTLAGQAGNGENSFNMSYSFRLGKKSPLAGYTIKTIGAVIHQEEIRGQKQDEVLDNHEERLEKLQMQVASLMK